MLQRNIPEIGRNQVKTEQVKKRYVNRDLSWLSFNSRVLQEAADEGVPLIERLRFLGIYSNNNDEFFRVRVAGIRRLVKSGVKYVFGTEEAPLKVLKKINEIVLSNQKEFNRIYAELIDKLEKENIFLLDETELDDEQSIYVKNYFQEKVHPALVPLMVQQTNSFPVLREKSVYFAVKLFRSSTSEAEFSLLEIPTDAVPRFIPLPRKGNKRYLIILDDVIRHCFRELYAVLNYDKIEGYAMKITRDAELDFEESVSQTFLDKIKKSLKKRKTAHAVRLAFDQTMPEDLKKFFLQKMGATRYYSLIPGGRYHNSNDFMDFPAMGRDDLLYPKQQFVPHRKLEIHKSILRKIDEGDVLLHYPYHSFNYFISLLREAAIDPAVKSINLTVYRLAKNSRVVNALINAAKNGKRVNVVVELQARFDEAANIKWAGILSEEGVNVVFGPHRLKVHSKLCLIERIDNEVARYYLSVGTGNFNEKTAELYSDLTLFTAHSAITLEAKKVFDALIDKTNHLPKTRRLILSPTDLRPRLMRYIDSEIKNKKLGKPALVFLKLNSLVDVDLIEKLYEAGQAGVEVKLIIRGICSLIPGKKGLSENISAISILDRFLEHSRVYVFGNAGRERVYISSADWMNRNLDSRVEVSCPVYNKKIRNKILKVMDLQWNDNVKARSLNHGKLNRKKASKKGDAPLRSQHEIYSLYI